MARILIIEDEAHLAELIALYCKNSGWDSLICHSAEEAMGAIKAAQFDLITLDINLPGIDGFAFLKTVRADLNCPVLIISAREADDEIILGLDLGADEYVTKPFAPKVLMARMSALMRRQSQSTTTEQETYQFGDFLLEPEKYSLSQADKKIRLSTREFDILILLARAENKPVGAYEILDSVWGNQSTEASAVGVYIQRLRKKLQTSADNSLIETVHGRGYALKAKRLN